MKEIKYTQINTGQINGFLDDPQNLYFANEKFMKCMKDYMQYCAQILCKERDM